MKAGVVLGATVRNASRQRWHEPRALALLCAAAYLAFSGIVLAFGGRSWYAFAHALGTGALLWSMRSPSRAARIVGDFAPLLLMPLLYGELPQIIAALGTGYPGYHDVRVQRWETSLFGEQPSRTFSATLPNIVLSEVLHAGYLAYYPAVFAPALILYVRGDRTGFARTVLALTVTYAVCWTIFSFYPVEGPRYQWGVSPSAPDGFFRHLAVTLLAQGSSRGAAFPSSHMAISAVQAVVAWRWNRSAAVALTLIAVLVGFGAVYGGFHYAVDMVCGAMLGVVIGAVLLAAQRARQ